MTRLMLVAGVSASVLALGYAAFFVASPGRRALAFKKFEQPSSVDLAGIATVQLAPSFHAIGPGTTGPMAPKTGFDPASVEFHRNERQITFRFEQGQRRNMGGYTEDPVLLNVTLFNPSLSNDDALRILGTTVSRFYPPVDDEPRKAAHFAAQQWLPDIKQGLSLTRSAETNKGRGDNLVSAPPARWLVIHVDPVRKVRVDMYTWQKSYSLDDARALVRKVAESVQPTPKLAALFASVKTVDERLGSQHTRAVENTVAKLKACGIHSLPPGEIVFSGTCAAWMSPSRREIHVARAVGRVPFSAATLKPRVLPQFTLLPLPKGKPVELIGPPDFQALMFYWDNAAGAWRLEGFGENMYDEEPRASALMLAIGARLGDRASAYVYCFARYDLQFHAERVAVDAFLFEANRVETALREGKLVSGVRAAPDAFGK